MLTLTLMRSLFLVLMALTALAAESRDERALRALAALEAAREPNSAETAAHSLQGWLRGDTPLAPATWKMVQRDLPAVLPKLDPMVRIRLVRTVAYWAPQAIQADAQSWKGDAIDAALSLVEAGINKRAQDLLSEAGQCLPSQDSMPSWCQSLPDAGNAWMLAWAEDYKALYEPRAKRFEALANAWEPARTPDLGMCLAECARAHPACQELVRILLRQTAASPGAEQPLLCGLSLLSMCMEPYDEAADLIAAAAAWFGQDLEIHGETLRPWRAHPRVGSALFKLLLDPAGGSFSRREMLRAGDDGRSTWTIALPPPEDRNGIVIRLLDGLEAGLQESAPSSPLTFQLAFHVMSFPDGYAGQCTPEVEARFLALLTGEDDLLRLLAFNLLGHVAGPAGIDAAYVKALPHLRDLLLPTDPTAVNFRGGAARKLPQGMGQLLLASRLRMSLCRVPLTDDDRKRVLAWSRWRSDLGLPAAAWLVRSAEPGQNPLTGRTDELLAEYWPRLVTIPMQTPQAPVDWRTDLAAARSYLRDVPDWDEASSVVDAHITDPKQFQAFLHMVTYAPQVRLKLAAALHGHQRLKDAVVKAVSEPPRDGQQRMDSYQLTLVLGDILREPRLAADAMAALPDHSSQLTMRIMHIARWAPDHPKLDALSTAWDGDSRSYLANPFRRWFLAVMRSRDPGVFPHAARVCHLQLEIGDMICEIIDVEPSRFAPYRDELRMVCAPRLENYFDLAMIEARLTP